MNSSESSVIVLDSDDEEDQSKCLSSKATDRKSSISKTNNQPIPSIVQNARSISAPTSNSSNQLGKSKIETIHQPSSLTKNVNSVSIIPLSKSQNPKIAGSSIDHIGKNLQAKISPKSSPRNSPSLPRNVTSSGKSTTTPNSGMINRKPVSNIGSSTGKEKLNESNRNIKNQMIPRENLCSKLKVNQQIKLGNNNNSQSILKRKLEDQEDPLGINFPNQIHPRAQNYKRIKPTLISSNVNPKWSQLPNTITIDDDDDDDEDDNDESNNLGNSSKPNYPQKMSKSRSNSITSSSVPSPSPSVSSTATSPQSQSSPTTPSPSLKDLSRRSSTPKTANSTENLREKKSQGTATLENSQEGEETQEKCVKDLHMTSDSHISNGSVSGEDKIEPKQTNEIIPAFEGLIEACRKSDNSNDMEILIEKKLLKYYHSIHPDFITSKSFKKIVENITNEILETPNLVYIKLKTIIEELKSRKNSKIIVVSNDGQTSTGNDEVDEKVRKLNKGLRKLKHMIAKMEEEEVDWDTEFNSSYLKVERFKKRACEIYEKICDLTGESKHAQRTVRKPIVFNHTSYPKINKAVETFVNKTKMFPDFHDILTILQHCNNNYNLDLTSEELKRIAQDAFVKVGKLLQNRRKTDLYETLSHYTEKIKDPALEDSDLTAKLNENKKHYGKINALIQKYAREQDTLQTEKLKAKEETRKINSNVDSLEKSTDNIDNTANENNPIKKDDRLVEEPIDEKIKSSSEINDKLRNTPSCSYTILSNSKQNIKDKNIDSDKKEISSKTEILKIDSSNKQCNDSSNSNNIKRSTDIQSNSSPRIDLAKTITSKESNNKQSNVNKDSSALKIINVTSLSQQSTKTISPLSKVTPSDKNDNFSKAKSSLISKSVMPSSLNVNNFSKKTISNKCKEVDEIILLDDDA